ncbi:hypothetical protein NW754_008600 [Fusarium falciforme]|nr:hypothetical protein NW754_008600 [Fusarium falciforme]
MASFRFILAIALSATLVHAQCYYPDGQEAPRDVPCKPDAEASACCAEGYICVSTGMCQFVEYAGTGRFARGSCTNQDWSSSECPNFCTDAEGEETGGTDVTRCQGYTDRFFCPRSQNANTKTQTRTRAQAPRSLGGAIGGSIGGFLLGGLGVWLIFFLRKAKKDALDRSRVVPEAENGYKDDHQPAPKAEMSAESAPAELPGYSVGDRSRQD